MDNQVDKNVKRSVRSHFDPAEYGLNPLFRLSHFGSVKVHGINFQDAFGDSNGDFNCSILPLRHRGVSLAQSSSSITAIIDDPFMMGRIACVNILSNLYGSGIYECDNIELNFKLSKVLNEKERDVIVQLMYNGFKETAKNAAIIIKGPLMTLDQHWCSIGGVATRVCNKHEYISPDGAEEGDVIVLTKPLGTQVAISAYQWIDKPEQWKRIKNVVSEEKVREAYTRAINSMALSNRVAAKLMHKYNAHCSTNISYLGLLEHANALANRQKNEVSFAIMNLPIFENMATISKVCGNEFKLTEGKCPEISGGILLCLPREQAVAYCKDIKKIEGRQAWIIGRVESGDRTAFLTAKARIIDEPDTKYNDVN